MWAHIARIATIVQNLTIIGGIIVGLSSLVFGQLGSRIEAVGARRTDYINNLRKEYVALLSRWDVPAYGRKILTTTDDDTKKIVLTFYNDPTNEASLLTFGDFFDELWYCVSAHLCDQNTAIDEFGTQARDIYESSAYYIDDKRQQDRDPNFCAGLEKFYRLEPQGYLARLFIIP
jgi:hypothetical protein